MVRTSVAGKKGSMGGIQILFDLAGYHYVFERYVSGKTVVTLLTEPEQTEVFEFVSRRKPGSLLSLNSELLGTNSFVPASRSDENVAMRLRFNNDAMVLFVSFGESNIHFRGTQIDSFIAGLANIEYYRREDSEPPY